MTSLPSWGAASAVARPCVALILLCPRMPKPAAGGIAGG